ncbi:MAG: hypothetical protein MI919_39800 [Holophagales bacterium]|nr:hypothetical protein [Holophagales bacterium]
MSFAEIRDENSGDGLDASIALASRYRGSEYEVVRLGLRPLPIAYGSFVAVFVWAQLYWRFWPGATWLGSMSGAFVLAVIGSIAAWRAKREAQQLTLPVLIALILDFGILLAVVVPTAAYFVIFVWPR